MGRDEFLEEYHPAHGKRALYYKKRFGHAFDVPANVRVIGWQKDSAGRTMIKMNNDDTVKESDDVVSGTRCVRHYNSKGTSIDVAFQKLLAEKRLEDQEKATKLGLQTPVNVQQPVQQENQSV